MLYSSSPSFVILHNDIILVACSHLQLIYNQLALWPFFVCFFCCLLLAWRPYVGAPPQSTNICHQVTELYHVITMELLNFKIANYSSLYRLVPF